MKRGSVMSLFFVFLLFASLSFVSAQNENETCANGGDLFESQLLYKGHDVRINSVSGSKGNETIKIKIDGEVVLNNLEEGDSLRTEYMIVKVTNITKDYTEYENSVVIVCLKDAGASCSGCQEIIKESQGSVGGCTDSDKNEGYPESYYVKGYAVLNSSGVKIIDSCKGEKLSEAACFENGESSYKIYECAEGCQDGACLGEIVEEVKEKCVYNGKEYIIGDTFPADDGCNVCNCETNNTVGCTKKACKNNIFVLSNGRNAEIKILPGTASEKAVERLGELNFTIELKEVGRNGSENVKAVYEAKAEKQGKFLGLFKIKGDVYVLVDTETGEIVDVKKPWWAFLAKGI